MRERNEQDLPASPSQEMPPRIGENGVLTIDRIETIALTVSYLVYANTSDTSAPDPITCGEIVDRHNTNSRSGPLVVRSGWLIR